MHTIQIDFQLIISLLIIVLSESVFVSDFHTNVQIMADDFFLVFGSQSRCFSPFSCWQSVAGL